MSTKPKPMLAATLERLEDLRPGVGWLGSPKLDGVRCLIVDGIAYSRNMEPIRNRHVQASIGLKALNGLDGELVVGDPCDNKTNGTVLGRSMACTKYEGKPAFTYHAFDRWDRPDRPFQWRHGSIEDVIDDNRRRPIALVPHTPLGTIAEATAHERGLVKAGFEGTCYRHPDGKYKPGRSTLNEGWLLKFKRFIDGEAVVLEVLEGNTNTNEVTTDKLGRPKRSTAAAGMVKSGKVGSLRCTNVATGEEMIVSAGTMKRPDRLKFMAQPKLLVGQVIVWRAFDYGVKDMLRYATFHGIRSRSDM